MSTPNIKTIVEGLLFASSSPLTPQQLQQLFAEVEQPQLAEIKDAIAQLQEDYQERAIELKQVASGFRFQVRPDCAQWVERLFTEKPPKFSRALLETLVLIAYRQPITRAEIEDIRGVSVSTHMVKTLLEYEWVRVVGYRDLPGKPALYATTAQFLDYFNLKSLSELPSMVNVSAGASAEANELMGLDQEGEAIKQLEADERAQIEDQTDQAENEEHIDQIVDSEDEFAEDEELVTEKE